MMFEIAKEEPVSPAKARLCVICRQYFSIACFLSDDGIDHATMCNRHGPAQNGLRYCQGCGDFVALDLFAKGCGVFACKKHMTAFGGGRESKQKQMNDTEKKRRIWTWRLCYADRKRFEQEKIAISQNEIEQAIIKIDPNPRLGMYIVMPVDSRAMICPQNVVVVTAEQRKKLMKLVHQNNIQEYNRIIMQLKLK